MQDLVPRVNEEKQDSEGDTDYLDNNPGMVESILKEAGRPLNEYSDRLDW